MRVNGSIGLVSGNGTERCRRQLSLEDHERLYVLAELKKLEATYPHQQRAIDKLKAALEAP